MQTKQLWVAASSHAKFAHDSREFLLAALDVERLRGFYRGLGGLGAAQRRAGKDWRRGSYRATLFKVAVAMQNDIEPRLDHRCGALFKRAGKRLHRQVVAQDEAVESDFTAHNLRDHDRRRRRGPTRIDRRVEEVRAHRHRKVARRRKRRKIMFKVAARGVDHGQLMMTVYARAAMPWHVLDDRRNPAR